MFLCAARQPVVQPSAAGVGIVCSLEIIFRVKVQPPRIGGIGNQRGVYRVRQYLLHHAGAGVLHGAGIKRHHLCGGHFGAQQTHSLQGCILHGALDGFDRGLVQLNFNFHQRTSSRVKFTLPSGLRHLLPR